MAAREHGWNLSPAEARALQRELAGEVELDDRFDAIRTVAGTDVGFTNGGRTTRAAVVVLDLASLEQLDSAVVEVPTAFPYVPGLLSFREAPALIRAVSALQALPDLLLCDGHGLAHPRRFGLACHLGLWLDCPSIGVGKSRLVGTFEEPGAERGDWSPLLDKGERIGAVLRSRARVRPIFVSQGHRVSLPSALALVARCLTRFRLPETTRAADKLAGA